MELRTRLLIGFGVLGALACVGAGYLAVRLFDIPRASMQTEAAARAYRDAGLPWEAKDVDSRLPVAEAENAAPLIRTAGHALVLKSYLANRIRIMHELGEGNTRAAAADLAPFGKAMNLAIAASKRPRADYHRDWDEGPALLFPEVVTIKAFVRLFCFRAELKSQLNDSPGAIADLQVAMRLSYLAGQDPCIIAMLVEVACHRFVFDSVRRCALTVRQDAKAIRALAETIEVEYREPNFVDALAFEAYMPVTLTRNMRLFPLSGEDPNFNLDKSKLKRTGIPADAYSRSFMTSALREWTEAKPMMDRYRTDPLRLADALDVIDHKWKQKSGLSNVLQDISFSAYPEAARAAVADKADFVITEALLHAVLSQAQTGRMPARLADIPGSWLDPFTGKPIRMTDRAGTLRIYSLGPNRKDDGGIGIQELEGDAKKDYDIVAAFPPPKRKN